MKRTKILLRVAATLMLIHLIGHSIGHSRWKKSTDPAQLEVIRQMTGPKFPFMGSTHSMGEYFDGYGYGCSICMVVFILVLWFISGELASSSRLANKTMIAIAICLLLWGLDEMLFFFPFAACTSLLAFVCTLAAYFLYMPSRARAGQQIKNNVILSELQ